MPLPRPSALVRRVAKKVWRRAAERFDAWVAPMPDRALHESTPRSSSTQIVARPGGGPSWTARACDHIDKWISRLDGAAAVQDAHAVRRLRSAVRRLRTIVAAVAADEQLREHWGREHRALDRGLRRLAKRLGPVRDLDVAIAKLVRRRRDCDAELERAAIDELHAGLVRRREHALARARRRLRPESIDEVTAALRLFVATAITEHGDAVLATRWWTPAIERLQVALDGAAPQDDLEALHTIRIAARAVRHGLAMFADVLPPEADRWAKRTTALQRALGEHRDAALFHARIVRRIDKATARGHLAFARGLELGRAAAAVAERDAWSAAQAALVDGRST